MDFDYILLNILGKSGVIIAVGGIVFIFMYKNSESAFAWIENQTFGKRDEILKMCEILFWKVDSSQVTWALLFLSFGISSIVFGFFVLFGKYYLGVFLAMALGFVGWKVPIPIMRFFVRRRIEKYSEQMVDALNLLSNGLRAGLSLPQSFGMVVEELPNPIAQEFNLVLQQNRLGVGFDECLVELNTRIPTEDNEMFITGVNILRETGGNLPETFQTISDVIKERVRLKQKIDSYIAQGKMQGRVIFSMPFALLVFLVLSDSTVTEKVFSSVVGVILLVVAFGLNLLGGFFMSKIINIKV